MATNDSHLAYLLGLGFDFDLCVSALNLHSQIEDATNWILGQNKEEQATTKPTEPETPVGTLPEQFSWQSSDNSPGGSNEHVPKDLSFQKTSSKMAIQARKEKNSEKQARERALQAIKEDKEDRKIRRVHVVEKQPKNDPVSQTTESNRSQELLRHQREIKVQRMLDNEAKKKALENIKQDREAKKNAGSLAQPKPVVISRPQSTTQSSGSALIQIRISDGSSYRKSFPSSTPFYQVFEWVLNQEKAADRQVVPQEQVSLVSTFPKLSLTGHEDVTLLDAGFVPNVSLHLLRTTPSLASSDSEAVHVSETTSIQAQPGDEEMEYENSNEDQDMTMPRIGLAQMRMNYWSDTTGGNRLVEPVDEVMAEAQGIAGEESAAEVQVATNDPTERDHRLSAILNRPQIVTYSTTPDSRPAHKKVRYGRSLKDICSSMVAGLITQSTMEARNVLKKLMFVSPDVSTSLVAQLIASGKLDSSIMHRIADQCYLQQVILDSYKLTTDSLLERLSVSNSAVSLIKLSIRGCDIVTDAGICYLKGLKKLEYLDISNCKLTDKGLQSLAGFPALRYLNLSKTKITYSGIRSLVNAAAYRDTLESLLVEGCGGLKADDLLCKLNEFTSLSYLSLAMTAIGSQQPIRQKHAPLAILDISNTELDDRDMIQTISGYRHLRELRMTGCKSITSVGLAAIPKSLLDLEVIQFPNREQELDDILQRYTDLPLQHMDLTGFLEITDVGLEHISKMKDLKYLSLEGTKVTDEGIGLLKDLLELETLYLDRTAVTDLGIDALSGLSRLTSLSLSRTNVTDEALKKMGDFEQTHYARTIRTLNLSKCHGVTGEGVQGLTGMIHLTHLNLDHTRASKQCLVHLQDLKFLKPSRLLGVVE
ncbi:hypothetical protein CLU79DRAFT_777262 [Phycomyces nitens]|nr:hypothetical protein CLU79DRAFT_777262 [Phycomyces nitens]